MKNANQIATPSSSRFSNYISRQHTNNVLTIQQQKTNQKTKNQINRFKMTEESLRNKASKTIIPKEFELMHKFWQASNYPAVGQVSHSNVYL